MLGNAFNDMANQLEARLAELEAERGRLRDAITRFGEALAATHDINQLLRVIVEAAVEATGANGARLLADDGTIVETGEPDSEGERLEFGLTAGRTSVRHADDRRRLVRRRATAGRELARVARRDRARERPAPPHRRAAGTRRRSHRDREPAAVRGRDDRGDRARRASRLDADPRARRSRRLQGGQRRPRPRRRRRRPPQVRSGAPLDRPRLRPRRPLGRRGVPPPPARGRRDGRRAARRSRPRDLRGARRLRAATGRR